jgi:hypothetical protein
VIPVAIAISCYFRLFGFRYGLTLADNFSEQPTGDRYLYYSGRMDTTLPFEELRLAAISTSIHKP